MAVPYTFATATSPIPLSQLDANFASTITLGNTAIQLGNTVTQLNNMTLANVTISSVSTPITPAQGGTGITAVGTSGNVLTSNGTAWVSQAPTAFAYPGAGITVSTGSGWGTSLTAPTGTIVGTTDTQTLTNKRIDPRVSSSASAASVTPNIAAYDIYAFTALAAALTINAPIGSPADGDKLIIRLLDNGTARALTWNSTFTAIGVTIPTTTVINKTTYVGCIYNANNTRWDVIATTTQA